MIGNNLHRQPVRFLLNNVWHNVQQQLAPATGASVYTFMYMCFLSAAIFGSIVGSTHTVAVMPRLIQNRPAAFDAMDLAATLRRPSHGEISDAHKALLKDDSAYLADVFTESRFFPEKHASKANQTPPKRKPDSSEANSLLSQLECVKSCLYLIYCLRLCWMRQTIFKSKNISKIYPPPSVQKNPPENPPTYDLSSKN